MTPFNRHVPSQLLLTGLCVLFFVGLGAVSGARPVSAQPSNHTIHAPIDQTFRQAAGPNDTLTVTYSYESTSPNTTTIEFADGSGNSATFDIDDSGYGGNGEQKSVLLELSNPDVTAGDGLRDGTTYDLTVTSTDGGGSQSSTESNVLTIDETSPATLTVDRPQTAVVRQSTDTLSVAYSYDDLNPDTTTIRLADGSGNTASFGVNDESYAGDDTKKTVVIDLANPDATSGSGVIEGTYNVTVETDDRAGNGASDTGSGTLTVDDTSPTNLTVNQPTDAVFRQSDDTLTVGYSYTESNPDSVTIQLADGSGNTASFGVNDESYAGDDTEKTVVIDLANADATSGSGVIEGMYDVTVQADDRAGNGASKTGSGTLTVDDTSPTNLTVDQPTDAVFRQSDDTLTVGYSYTESEPDSMTIELSDGSGNTASFAVNDAGYAGDNSEKSLVLDLSSPTTTGGSGLIETSYDITVIATDRADNEATTTGGGTVTIDDTSPSVTAVTLGNDGSDNLTLTFQTNEPLGDASGAVAVSVDGPATTDLYTFDRSDFNESGSYTYSLTGSPAYSDGGGTYSAAIDDAIDRAGNDGADGTQTDTYTNEAPTAVVDEDTTDEDTPLSVSATGILANDTDPEGDALEVERVNGDQGNVGTQLSLSGGALLTVQADGAYSYDPNGEFEDLGVGERTVHTFRYTASDGIGESGSVTDTLVIEGRNDPPTARDTTVATTEDDVLNGGSPGVLGNDSDVDQDGLVVSAVEGSDTNVGMDVTLSSGAVVNVSEDGSFDYDPNGQFDGLKAGESTSDSFTYTAADGNGGTDQATVSVDISGVNDVPVVGTNDVLAVGSQGGTSVISDGELRALDPDDAAGNLTFSVTEAPTNGTLVVGGNSGASSFTQADINNQDVEYTHDGSSTSRDSLTFDLADDAGAGPTGTTFQIVIGLDNQAPSASNDASTTTENDNVVVSDPANGVLANDSDPDGDALTVSEVNGVSGNVGTEIELASGALLQLNADGTYSYDPNGSFEDLGENDSDSESFSYTAADGKGGTSQATVTITIDGVNDAPVLSANTGLNIDVGSAKTITTSELSTADVDDAPSALTYSVSTSPTQGVLVVNGTRGSNSFTQQQLIDGKVQYDHTATSEQDDDFTFAVSDDAGAGSSGNTFTISVSRNNIPPTARDTTLTTNEDEAISGSAKGVLENDSDPNGDALSVSAVNGTGANVGTEITLASGALLTVNGDGSYSYDPNDQFESLVEGDSTEDSFTYTAADVNGATDGANVTVKVYGRNELPRVTLTSPIDGATVRVGEQVTLVATAQDQDGTVEQIEFRADNTTIGTDQDASDGFTATWTPSSSGPVAVTARATDDLGGVAETDPVNIQVREAGLPLSVRRQFPNPTQRSSFRLVALPGEVRRSLGSTLSDLSSDDWRAFREKGQSDSLAFQRTECGEPSCTLEPGNGYWLIAREAWTVEDSIDVIPLVDDTSNAGGVYTIPLQDGWNIISNPLEVDVAWSAVQGASGTNQSLWRWDGRWEEVQTFSTAAADGEAYYFRDSQLDSLVVPYPSTSGSSSPRASVAEQGAKDGAGGSGLSLQVVGDDRPLSEIRVGVRPNGAVGLDRSDRFGPPAYFGPATLRLVENSGERTHLLAAEYKPPNKEGYSFDAHLIAPPDTAVTLAARGLEAFADAEEVVLVRRPTGREYDLREDSTFTTVPRTQTTRFKLLVGSKRFVDDAKEDIAPEKTKLLPNYPEPVRQRTTIEYALPTEQDVRLEVYDILGRRVQVLVNGTRNAGFHTLRWPDGAGETVASGMYFLRLETDGATKTERIVVVR